MTRELPNIPVTAISIYNVSSQARTGKLSCVPKLAIAPLLLRIGTSQVNLAYKRKYEQAVYEF